MKRHSSRLFYLVNITLHKFFRETKQQKIFSGDNEKITLEEKKYTMEIDDFEIKTIHFHYNE
ncbi:MAG: hypothetical protein KC736_01405 [Candidatus Moranbacteria bacterium]|nr:hypothetical protein [Candidatus Moranbacteria bacterium]